MLHLSELIGSALDSGDPDLAESLRPFYLDYLRKHHVQAGQADQPK